MNKILESGENSSWYTRLLIQLFPLIKNRGTMVRFLILFLLSGFCVAGNEVGNGECVMYNVENGGLGGLQYYPIIMRQKIYGN